MDPDNKNREDQTSKGTDPFEEADGSDEIIDLIDAISPDDESGSGDTEEDFIDLSDLVDEPLEEAGPEEAGLGLASEDAPSLESEDEFIDLVDEVEDDVRSDDEEVIELSDVVEEQDYEDEETIELSDVVEEQDYEDEEILELDDVVEEQQISEPSEMDLGGEEFDEDTLIEDVGLEMPEEALDIAFTEESLEESGVSLSDVETSPDAMEITTGKAAAAALGPTDEELESKLLEGVSDERIETIITRLATKRIEEKADRILLEVAETAIAKEIEKLKQAL